MNKSSHDNLDTVRPKWDIRRWTIFTIVGLCILVPVLWIVRTHRQFELDRQLIAAIKSNETGDVLQCLESGANPNARDQSDQENSDIHNIDDLLEWLKHRTRKQEPHFHKPALIVLVERLSDAETPVPYPENPDIARALLDHGADINARDEKGATALLWALVLRQDKTARLLLERGADIHVRAYDGGETTLMEARGEFTEELIRRGADVNTRDDNGFTPLHEVCMASDLQAIRSLIAHGANVNATASNGTTPLQLAAWSRHKGSLETMKYLLEHGADIRVKTTSGITVLMRAAQSGNVDKVRLVLSKGLDVNARTRGGRTVLMFGVRGAHPGILKMLLEHGADANASDSAGRTALTEAKDSQNAEKVRLLKAAGAKEPPASITPPKPVVQ